MTDLVQPLPAAVAEVKTSDEADHLRREVEAFIAIARKAPAKQIEVEWPALLRLRLDAWRRWGELLGEPESPAESASRDRQTRLGDGERKNRERARKLAFEVPDDAYFAFRAQEHPDKLTLAGALRLVPSVDVPAEPLPSDSFRTFVVDPPWRYGNTATRGAAEDHYPTMSIPQLCAMGDEIADRRAPDAHLYLWVTNNFLREGFEVLDAWGFSYKTCLTWVKPQMGMGNYFRGSTEHILFAVCGRLRTNRRDLVNWFQAPRAKHSAKPDLFYDLVEQASPGPYLELFARKARLGDWSYWGNEVLADLELAA